MIGVRTRILNATRGEGILPHGLRLLRRRPRCRSRSRRGRTGLHGLGQGHGLRAAGSQGPRNVVLRLPAPRSTPGQVVGEHCKDDDILVNMTRTKKLTNIRSSTAEKFEVMVTPRNFSVEEALEYLDDDEFGGGHPRVRPPPQAHPGREGPQAGRESRHRLLEAPAQPRPPSPWRCWREGALKGRACTGVPSPIV